MIYSLLKVIVKIALNVFFKSISTQYDEPVPKDRPLIFVANHPSTFMDAMVIGSIVRQPLYFLSKGSLFANRLFQFFFNMIHMIPIYRAQDDPAMMSKNENVFKRCYDFLSKRKALLIFPEGISKHGRRLHKIKTGAARIALGAEKLNNYSLGVTIIPVGINYSNAGVFRSNLLLSFGPPVHPSDFFDLHMKDDRKAVAELTDCIRKHLEAHTIHIETEELNILVEQIEMIYKQQVSEELGLSLKSKIDGFKITKGIIDAVHYYYHHDPRRVKELQDRIIHYTNNLSRFHLKDNHFQTRPYRGSLSMVGMKNMLFFFLGLPVYICGIAANYLPYKLTDILRWKISNAIEYQGPLKLLLGVVLFPTYYLLLIGFIWLNYPGGWLILLNTLAFPLSGLFALHYWDRMVNLRGVYKTFSLFYRKNIWVALLIEQRLNIINLLKTAHEDYTSEMEHPHEK